MRWRKDRAPYISKPVRTNGNKRNVSLEVKSIISTVANSVVICFAIVSAALKSTVSTTLTRVPFVYRKGKEM
jgi:hypothetical protein